MRSRVASLYWPRWVWFWAWLLVTGLSTAWSRAAEVPPLAGRVNDLANLLSPESRRSLTDRLAAFEQRTGHQVAVLTVPTLGGDPIEDFSIRVVEAWKLGRAQHDDGVLILVVPQDRKMRIEVGYGLEGVLPDATAGRITREVMAPRLRRGDYQGGITAAVDAVLRATGEGEGVTPGAKPARPGAMSYIRGIIGFILLALLFPFLLLLGWLNRLGGGGRRHTVYFGGGGFGGGYGGFGGGSSGGGFGGGGGGFGGGGASGDW